MAVIDPDGFYNGDRMALLSDAARLHWPHLFLLCNGHARFEVNLRRILDRAYGAFQLRPTEDEILGYLHEYHDAYLLFLYESNGKAWGQWDTSERFLPNYKTAHDLRTPPPCANDLLEWKKEYAERKSSKRSGMSILSRVFGKPPENCGKPSDNFGEVMHGVGVGVGVVEGKTYAQNSVSRGVDAQIPKIKSTDLQQSQAALWFEQFWSSYWLKKDKKRSFERFEVAVKSEEIFHAVILAVKAQSAEMLSREPRSRPYASTWLNGERWNDEAAMVPVSGRSARHDAAQSQAGTRPENVLRLTEAEREQAKTLFGQEDSE